MSISSVMLEEKHTKIVRVKELTYRAMVNLENKYWKLDVLKELRKSIEMLDMKYLY